MQIQNNYNTKYNTPFQARYISPSRGNTFLKQFNPYMDKLIYVCTHSSMDNDGLCSEFIANYVLGAKGIKTKICAKSEQLQKLFLSKSKEIHTKLKKKPDLIVAVDFNDVKKIPKLLVEMFEGKGNKVKDYKSGIFEGTDIVGVDHHVPEYNLKGNFYIDETARSCSGIWVRLADSLGVKLNKKHCKIAYCGMVSDYEKSGLVEIKKGKLIKLPALYNDKNSLEVLEKVEAKLSNKDKKEVHKHIDVMSRLTPQEKAFHKKMAKNIKISSNGKFAYVAIEPNDKDWAKVGMDNDTTSTLIRNFRKEILKESPDKKLFAPEQIEAFKNVQNVAIFYRTSPKSHGVYKVSVHSRNNSALKLIRQAEAISGQKIGGGHPNRGGGKLTSLDKTETEKFVNSFAQASEYIV